MGTWFLMIVMVGNDLGAPNVSYVDGLVSKEQCSTVAKKMMKDAFPSQGYKVYLTCIDKGGK